MNICEVNTCVIAITDQGHGLQFIYEDSIEIPDYRLSFEFCPMCGNKIGDKE